jgi:hypothetical protein
VFKDTHDKFLVEGNYNSRSFFRHESPSCPNVIIACSACCISNILGSYSIGAEFVVLHNGLYFYQCVYLSLPLFLQGVLEKLFKIYTLVSFNFVTSLRFT